MSEHVETLIIGAGLAGLAAALELSKAGRQALVLEAGDRVGGRMRTDHVDGYLIDDGFQVVNPYYPELRRLGVVEELDLQPLTAGVEVSLGGAVARLGDPRRAPELLLPSALANVGSPVSKARLALYALHCAQSPAVDLIEQDDTDFESALRSSGIAELLYRTTLRPFLTGVFLDSPGRVSRRYGDLVLRSFVRGTPALPARGVQALPQALAARLPLGAIRLNTQVEKVGNGWVESAMGRLEADAIIIATDPRAAAGLTGATAQPTMKSCTTYYHAVHQPPVQGKSLRVDGRDRGPVVNSVVLSNVAPSYAPSGMHLVASTTLSGHPSAEEELAVRRHLSMIWGVDTRSWLEVARRVVPDALPAQRPGRPIARAQQISERLWVAGDHMDTPSQQGALVSGRRAARSLLGI